MDFRFLGSKVPNASPMGVVKDVILGTAASISVGQLFRHDNGDAGYVMLAANGDTDTLTLNRVYLCTKASTETAAADGVVEGIWAPSMRLLGTVTTPGNLAQAVIDSRVTLDVAAGVQKIDENDTSNGFMRIARPLTGADGFDSTNGYDTEVIVNETIT